MTLDISQPSFLARPSDSLTTALADEASYVDDAVCFVVAPASSCIEAVSTAAAIIDSEYAEYDCEVNFAPSKTEAVLHYFGPGSYCVRMQVHSELQRLPHVR